MTTKISDSTVSALNAQIARYAKAEDRGASVRYSDLSKIRPQVTQSTNGSYDEPRDAFCRAMGHKNGIRGSGSGVSVQDGSAVLTLRLGNEGEVLESRAAASSETDVEFNVFGNLFSGVYKSKWISTSRVPTLVFDTLECEKSTPVPSPSESE